ncbi:MAG: ATP synthase F1 subunit gamma [Deltaproteobacteria bacterium]|nr:ATP synthase F1 subunit gamma [Deltaproteobacteria bacterium]
MASLKDIKRQIRAVKQTQKLTKAMNMVAAAKLRATQGRTENFRAYAEEHHRLVEAIGRQSQDLDHPIMRLNEKARRVKIMAVSSDRGLCGSFNTNLSHLLDGKIKACRDAGREVSLFLVGRKLKDYYSRRQVEVSHAMTGVLGNFDYPLAQEITEALAGEYLEGQIREVWILTTKFLGLARQEPTLIPFLPLVHEIEECPLRPYGYGYLVEPDPATLFKRLIPRSLTITVFQALLESVTSENAARMQAMDNASKNCKEITESLTMIYNKLRQAAVTNELLDIVNGSEALAAA